MAREANEKAIDYIRRKVEESKLYCETEAAEESVDAILGVLNKHDYIFFRLNPEATEVVFRLTGVSKLEARLLYEELINPKEFIKYQIYRLSKLFKR